MNRLTIVLLGSTATLLLPNQASAQAEVANDVSGDNAAGEIVVTATRQNVALSKVPISVAAYSQEKLDAQGVRRIDDIARLTPGLSLTPSGGADISGNRQNISIRGVSSNIGAATTGVYLDDTPIQVRFLGNASSNAYPQIFDLERVEVLRGPQGTLFGAGAEGGTVRFITPSPDLHDYSAYARGEVAFTEHGTPSFEAGGAVGGPISAGTVGFRLSASYRHDGGFVDRVDHFNGQIVERDANSKDSWTVRGALKFQPADDLDVTLSVYHQDVRQNGSNILFMDVSDLDKGIFRNSTVLPQLVRDKFTLPSLNIEYDAGFAKFISTTSYFHRNASVDIDYTAFTGAVLFGNPYFLLPGEYSATTITDKQRAFTQEFRIQSSDPDARLNWVLGGFYSHAKQPSLQETADPFADAIQMRRDGRTFAQRFGSPLYQGRYSFINSLENVDKQTAAFGQVDFKIVEALKLTAGVRVAHSVVEFDRNAIGPIAGANGIKVTGRQSENPVTPKFGASWQVDKDNMLYASAAKGYRVGGINGPQIALCDPYFAQLGIAAPTTYKSDSVWSYEVGSKNRLFDGKLRVDASAFHIDWSNIQRSIRITQCGSTFVTNLGKAKSDGFDLAIDLKATDQLTLGFSLGYVNARLSESVFGIPTNNVTPLFAGKGDKIGGAPWNYSVSGQYDFDLSDRVAAYVRSDFQHTGQGVDLNYNVVGADPTVGPSEAFDQLSLRAGVKMSGLDVSVFVNNLLNEAPSFGRRRDSLASPLYFDLTARPRTVGLTASYRY